MSAKTTASLLAGVQHVVLSMRENRSFDHVRLAVEGRAEEKKRTPEPPKRKR